MSTNFEILEDKLQINYDEHYPNCELVQRGFRILHPKLLDYIINEFRKEYSDNWVQEIFRTLKVQKTSFALNTSEKDARDFLDIANCLRVFTWKWEKFFKKRLQKDKEWQKYKSWAEELKGNRNEMAHIGGNDFEPADAWRILDTMSRFCRAFDPEAAEEICALCNCVKNPIPGSTQPQTATPHSVPVSEKKPTLKGTVSIQKEPYNPKCNTLTLRAVAESVPSSVTYQWKFAWRKGSKFILLPNTESRLPLVPQGNFGKIYRCEVSCAGYTGALIGEYGPLTKADLDTPLEATSKKQRKPSTAAKNKGEISTSAKDIQTKEIPKTTPTKQQTNRLASQGKFDITKTPDLHHFDSQISRLHYFAAPRNDYYAANSLEYVDYPAFLYLLLKEEGYRRVVIVRNTTENEKYTVIAYDAFSQVSFLHPFQFEAFFSYKEEKRKEDFQAFCKLYQSEFTYEKAVICTIEPESFKTFVEENVRSALQSNLIKTAVVLPLELLRENNCLTMESIRTFGIDISTSGSNILLITADRPEDFSELPDCGQLLVASDTPGQDEITNLLYKQKMDQPERFRLLPWSKIPSLAKFIWEKCSTSSGTAQSLQGLLDNTWYVGPLRNLEAALQKVSIRKALEGIAVSLPTQPAKTAPSANSRRPTDLERLRGGQHRKKMASLGLLTRHMITRLPNPYEGIDIHGASFPDRCVQSVVRIETEYGSASAFIISPDGYAITCAHAVSEKTNLTNWAEKKRNAYCKSAGQHPLPFEIKNTRPDVDLALIKIEARQMLPYLRLAEETREIHLGEECCLYGYPEGREGIMRFPVTISTQAERDQNGELGHIYYFSGDAEPGDSGGPIIAKSDGLVIGILRGARGEHSKFNYMKPIRYFWIEFFK